MGKTSLVEAACLGAVREGRELLTACGSELESGFAFGVVRQLFEHRLASVTAEERETLLSGRAAAARPLLTYDGTAPADDTSRRNRRDGPRAAGQGGGGHRCQPGIGLAVTRALVDEGAHVVAGARRSSAELDALADTGR
jgi:hypothetical protein